jgi:hypothetical protein
MRRALIFVCLASTAWWLWPDGELRHPPGIIAPTTPAQQAIPPKAVAEIKGYQIQAQASYAIHARVLHTKRYWMQGGELVPYDIALGWGPMSDQAVLDHLDISQSNRFFFYQWSGAPPIPTGEIVRNAANVHVISANRKVAAAVGQLRPGQLVAMRGYLVNVTGPNGFHWNTSLSRDDTGDGACEVFYVQELLISNDPLPADYAKIAVVAPGSNGKR